MTPAPPQRQPRPRRPPREAGPDGGSPAAPVGAADVAPPTASRIARFRGGGEALSPAARSYFEPRLGHDLSAVRLHTGPEAAAAAGEVGARAFAVGTDIAFGAGQYRPESREGRRLLAHELAHTVQPGGDGLIRRSPLSDQVEAAFAADPTLEGLLARLNQSDVRGVEDKDVDDAVKRLLAGREDDLWVALRVRQGRLDQAPGVSRPARAKPVEAVFVRGASTRRALVIAGVHGSERQGIEVARLLITDFQTAQPFFTVIVVPSLFPDNAAVGRFGKREGDTPTNRNFPKATQDLAAARKAGRGTAVDAAGRAILAENVLLLELIERFGPERIITIHGTHRAGAGGVFYDPRALRDDEVAAARQEAAEKAFTRPLPRLQYTEGGQEELRRELQEIDFQRRLRERTRAASDADRDLALRAAAQIDTDTAGLAGRGSRKFATRENEDPAKIPPADLAGRRAHPSVAGNVGPTGALDRASWSGSGTGGVSLGEYAPARGISVFTVEPPINRTSADYPSDKDAAVSAADRLIELQSYADAVRTVLLGKD